VAPRRDWTTLGAIILPLCVVGGYGLVTGIGFLWPERATVAIVAAMAVSIVLWVACAVWFQRRTRWWHWVGAVLFAGSLLFPMVGTASLGTDLALEKKADRVSGEVVDVDVEQTNRREDQESWKTTYTFVAVDDGRELGTVDYRGKKDGYDLDVGDHTDLLVDPSGDLPAKLAEKVDSSADIGMIVLGGVLFVIGYGIGLGWPIVRRAVA